MGLNAASTSGRNSFVVARSLYHLSEGNVTIRMPGDMAVKILATTGLGKIIMDPRFGHVDKNTYQSPDYDTAANKVEITVKSGAGDVSVNTK